MTNQEIKIDLDRRVINMKTIKDFTSMYYPSKEEMEYQALKRFVDENCCVRDQNTIYHTLRRAGVKRIVDFYSLDTEEISKFRNVGKIRYRKIIELKNKIDEYLNDSH